MTASFYHPPIYQSRHPLAQRAYLLAWRTIGGLLFRVTPFRLGIVRRFLLSAFGAAVDREAFVHPTCRIYAPRMLSLGERSCLAAGVDCYCVDRIEIGDDVTVSQDAFLCTASHDIDRADRPLVTAPIRIGRGAWIFARATILPGVSVGEGAVVAACAVVTRDVPAYAVVAGNPARVVRQRTYRGPPGDGESHDG
jgi:putative colanic acid biosynthesis acetyltransferase WcaF